MKIAILMATYNGEKFIEKQILSIIDQTVTDWDLYISDDQSTDNTVKIIKEYENKDQRIHLYSGDKKGPRNNFLKLFSKIESDYYFFCDQDDLWEKDKIKTMIKSVKEYDMNVPLLAYSNLECIDANDKIVGGGTKASKS